MLDSLGLLPCVHRGGVLNELPVPSETKRLGLRDNAVPRQVSAWFYPPTWNLYPSVTKCLSSANFASAVISARTILRRERSGGDKLFRRTLARLILLIVRAKQRDASRGIVGLEPFELSTCSSKATHGHLISRQISNSI